MKMKILFIVLSVFYLSGCNPSKQIKKHSCDGEHGCIKINKIEYPGSGSIIKGIVKDQKTGELLPFATVMINGGKVNSGVHTDLEGRFELKNIANGNYNLKVCYVGYDNIQTILNIDKQYIFNVDCSLSQRIVMLEKPIIYLYPEKKTDIHVQLIYDGKLTHSYPKYPEKGWKLTSDADGNLTDENGKEYYALFWEGEPQNKIIPKDGFVIPGKETLEFLEEKLSFLGLNRREANEFIMYWLPRMEDNPFNLIHFAGKEYEQLAQLKITPRPETIIRVMMFTQPLQHKIEFPRQDLSKLQKTRSGFTVVEWGGSEIQIINEYSIK